MGKHKRFGDKDTVKSILRLRKFCIKHITGRKIDFGTLKCTVMKYCRQMEEHSQPRKCEIPPLYI